MDEDRAYIEKRFRMKELSVQDTKPKAFSDDDIALLMEKPNRKADFAEWRTYVIVCWIMDNGARAQTVCCVKMEDIDLKKKDHYIRPHEEQKGASSRYVGHPQNHSERVHPKVEIRRNRGRIIFSRTSVTSSLQQTLCAVLLSGIARTEGLNSTTSTACGIHSLLTM